MTLSERIKKYRDTHGLSQRQFAIICGLSNGYIAMIERGVNPSTGEPIKPSLVALKKISTGMGISMATLFAEVDDIPVDLGTDWGTEGEASAIPSHTTHALKKPLRDTLLDSFERLNQEGKKRLVETADDMVASGKYAITTPSPIVQIAAKDGDGVRTIPLTPEQTAAVDKALEELPE